MKRSIQYYEKGGIHPSARAVVQEFPLRLSVNGRELATLIVSPHQLNFMVAGFLRNQGFIDTLEELLSLGICEDFGVARVHLSRELPDKLMPTLTSGCGTGISFNLPEMRETQDKQPSWRTYPLESVFALMQELQQRSEHYRQHGGIHSAAVGDGERLLLHAEDIGRHNTFDRIAGEALFRGIDLTGKILVTSGRISAEMVAKAARLGIAVIASRTSPTDMAIDMCDAAGISLVGYLRGKGCDIYSHPGRIAVTPRVGKIHGITGVILAGGSSRRMKSDKSLLPLHGARFIDHVYRVMNDLFEEVLIVSNSPELYAAIDCRKVPDIYCAKGVLAGIHAGLVHARSDRIFVVGCDMPFINPQVVRAICTGDWPEDVVIPVLQGGHEPLHALYGRNCITAIEEQLQAGRKRIISFFPWVNVRELGAEHWQESDPEGLSFRNINTPEEYFQLRGEPVSLGLSSKEQQRESG